MLDSENYNTGSYIILSQSGHFTAYLLSGISIAAEHAKSLNRAPLNS